jgi:hypothetical protein
MVSAFPKDCTTDGTKKDADIDHSRDVIKSSRKQKKTLQIQYESKSSKTTSATCVRTVLHPQNSCKESSE